MSERIRLDALVTRLRLTTSRSQAESTIKLGAITVNGVVVKKPGVFVPVGADVKITQSEQFVSRAGLKLASVADLFSISFKDKIVLDVGSSTGGFTQYALRRGAKKVFAVDVGTEQLHPSLRSHPGIELHEKTDIRDFVPSLTPDIVVMDVSFISLREILPHIASLSSSNTQILAMVKPQFEAGREQVNKGVIKNDSVRRAILKDFENWARQFFVIKDKADSDVAGAKGNQERFYHLISLQKRN
jgi:23S rRNA (cytidine1920-2'-O)/16S rRNA (cytidine1409-2'-O)-methyltransferase